MTDAERAQQLADRATLRAHYHRLPLRDAIRAALATVRAEEREACAQRAEAAGYMRGDSVAAANCAREIAATIRARGEGE